MPSKSIYSLLSGCLLIVALALAVFAQPPSTQDTAKDAPATEWQQQLAAGKDALKQGDFAAAEKFLQAALKDAQAFGENDPRLAQTIKEFTNFYNVSAEFKSRKQDYDGAIEAYLSATKLNPQFATFYKYKLAAAYANRAALKYSKQDLDGAIDDYTHAIDNNSENATIFSNRATARAIKGDLDGALDDYSRAIKIDAKLTSAYANRALVHNQLGHIKEAQADLEIAKQLDPTLPITLPTAAASTTTASASAGSVAACLSASSEKMLKGDLDGAIADYDRAIELEKGDGMLYKLRGFAQECKKNSYGAISDYLAASRLGGGNRTYYDQLLADSTHAIEQDGKNAQAYKSRGFVRFIKGDYDGAVSDFSRVISLESKNSIGYIYRGIAKSSKQDFLAADADLEKAEQIEPTFAACFFWRAASEMRRIEVFKDIDKMRSEIPSLSSKSIDRSQSPGSKDDEREQEYNRGGNVQYELSRVKTLDAKLFDMIGHEGDFKLIVMALFDQVGKEKRGKN
jgi:tetratricopeptide (TPR) repeat protein